MSRTSFPLKVFLRRLAFIRSRCAPLFFSGLCLLTGLGLHMQAKGQARSQSTTTQAKQSAATTSAYAVFAGGCFWCMEKDFERVPGVQSVVSGYTDGDSKAPPTYQEVSSGRTGFVEAVRVEYDPRLVSYAKLVDYFWQQIDPTVKNQQFCDVGSQYRTGIYWQNETERNIAQRSKDRLLQTKRIPVIHTDIKAATPFYPAETYHQDYYKKNPVRYAYYRQACGRDAKLKSLWGGDQ